MDDDGLEKYMWYVYILKSINHPDQEYTAYVRGFEITLRWSSVRQSHWRRRTDSVLFPHHPDTSKYPIILIIRTSSEIERVFTSIHLTIFIIVKRYIKIHACWLELAIESFDCRLTAKICGIKRGIIMTNGNALVTCKTAYPASMEIAVNFICYPCFLK